MIYDDDLAAILDDIGEDVTINGKTVKALYDVVQVEINSDFQSISTYRPHLTVQTVEYIASGASKGSAVVRKGKNYSVDETEEDGHGVTTVRLYTR